MHPYYRNFRIEEERAGEDEVWGKREISPPNRT